MEYIITNVQQNEDLITTTVEMTLSTGVKTIDIIHFRPGSVEEINQSICNRIITEQSKIDAIKTATDLTTMIPIGEAIII
jgi:hypothetical protein